MKVQFNSARTYDEFKDFPKNIVVKKITKTPDCLVIRTEKHGVVKYTLNLFDKIVNLVKKKGYGVEEKQLSANITEYKFEKATQQQQKTKES